MRPVLIVDDSPWMRSRMGREVRASALSGAEVLEAADARAALATLDQRPEVGLVIVDLGLPEVDGVALVDAIRARPGARPRTVLTASEWPEGVRARAREAGVDALLTRPFGGPDLDRVAG